MCLRDQRPSAEVGDLACGALGWTSCRAVERRARSHTRALTITFAFGGITDERRSLADADAVGLDTGPIERVSADGALDALVGSSASAGSTLGGTRLATGTDTIAIGSTCLAAGGLLIVDTLRMVVRVLNETRFTLSTIAGASRALGTAELANYEMTG